MFAHESTTIQAEAGSLLALAHGRLTTLYEEAVEAGALVRDQVSDFNQPSALVPDLVRQYLNSAACYLEALVFTDEIQGQALSAHLKQVNSAFLATRTACQKPQQEQIYACFAALYNAVVDSYDAAIYGACLGELVDPEQDDADEAETLSGGANLLHYQADLGTWERGIRVDIAANSDQAAMRLADLRLSDAMATGRLPADDSQMVVQIYACREGQADELVCDFMGLRRVLH